MAMVTLGLVAIAFLWQIATLDNLSRLRIWAATLEVKMETQFESLAAEVRRNQDVTASAVTLIEGLHSRLDAAIEAAKGAGATPDQLAEIQREADALRASSDGLAAAVAQNTVAESAPAAVPDAAPAATDAGPQTEAPATAAAAPEQ